MDLEQLIKDFLEYLEIERNVSQLTIRNYRHYLSRFVHFLTRPTDPASPPPSVKTAPVKITDITAERIRQYRLYLSRFTDEKGMSLKRVTQNYHLIALRSF